MKSRKLLALLVLAFASIAIANYSFLQRHLTGVLSGDSRNSGIEASAHYDLYVRPSVLVFNLTGLSSTNSPADVFRVFLQFAATQKDKEFTTVVLAHRGTPKFQLKGEFFRTVGREYGTQNAVYTMRTFPENLYRIDGAAAFGTWTGGLLGVVSKQIEDFNEFHKQWYIADLSKRAP